MIEGERIVITGASGYLGGHLLRALGPRNDVTVLGRRPPETSGVAFTFVPWDMTSAAEPAWPAKADLVLHLAQEQGRDPARAADTFAVNTWSVARLAQFAARSGARTYVQASTGSVYGFADHPFTEDTPPAPPDHYAATKLAAEVVLRRHPGAFGRVVLRYFMPYGPGQVARMVPGILQRVLEGRPVTVNNGVGQPRCNPIYLDDVVEATVRALALPEEATRAAPLVNIAGDEVVTVADLAQRLARLAGKELKVEPNHDPAVKDMVADTGRMAKLLGVRPKVGLDEGLRRTLEAARAAKNGPRS